MSIAPVLCRIINQSFSSGIFPSALKTARVCPVFKSGDRAKVNNYRPISVLPSFSKIFEKLVFNTVEFLVSYLEKHSILSDSQYGLRKGPSTSLAILDMVDKISNALADGKFSVGVFIDLFKAFDTLNLKILP